MWENISLALAGLMANKMRALLTMLGIIIGIGSVIAIICVGDSLTQSMTSSMNEIGAGNIMVSVREKDTGNGGMGGGMDSITSSGSTQPEEGDLVSYEQLLEFKERFSDRIVDISVSFGGGNGKAQDGRLYSNVSINGVNPGYKAANSVDIINGRFISERDVQSQKNVAVISDKFAQHMFKTGEDPLEKEIKVYTGANFTTYTVVGVYHYVPSAFGGFGMSSDKDIRTNLYIPVSTAKKDEALKGYQSFTVTALPGEDTNALTADIRNYWNKIYERNTKWECAATNMESMIETITSMLSTISIAVAVIAAISLLVGGIGVMNIMLVSVTERTREIGTRKALGAKNKHIRMQFIVESVIICIIGGIIGIITGLALGTFGASLLGYPAAISVPVILLCVAFSMAVGIFFGSYPASKAAKLDPIEALRYE